jgi:DNA-binding NarL/FixJ family response regulator
MNGTDLTGRMMWSSPSADKARAIAMTRYVPQASPGNAPQPHLTERQLEVLSLLCEGLPNKLICRRLNIAAGTVKVHISSILRELGATSRLQAVVMAQRMGFLKGNGASGPSQQQACAA